MKPTPLTQVYSTIRRPLGLLALFSAVLFSASTLKADTLAFWDMQAAGVAKANANTVGAGLTASALTGNTTLNTLGTITFLTDNYIAWSINSSTPSSPITLADAILNATYWSFTLTPNAGQNLTITSLSFDALAGTGGPSDRAFYVLSDKTTYLDGAQILSGRTTTGSPLMPYNTALADVNFSVDLSGNSLFANITDSVTFRIYIRTPTSSQNIGFDNLTVNGLVAPVPEPSTLAMLGLGGLALMAVNRLRR